MSVILKKIGEFFSRMNKKTRLTLRILSFFLAVICVVLASGLLYVHSLLANIDREHIEGMSSINVSDLMEPDIDPESNNNVSLPSADITDYQKQYEELQSLALFHDKDIKIILLIGSDSPSATFSGNSDSMILAAINEKTNKIHLISLSRTMLVNVPKYGWSPLNSAYSFGGTKLLIQTLENNFRVQIDDYVVINFQNFEKLIDVVGGVDIELTAAEANVINTDCGRSYAPGVNRLDGVAALSYSRIRKIDSDFRRQERQRTVITQLINKAVHSDLGTLNDLAVTVTSLINTSMKNNELLSLALSAPSYLNSTIDSSMIPSPDTRTLVYIPFAGISNFQAYEIDFYSNITTLRNIMQS